MENENGLVLLREVLEAREEKLSTDKQKSRTAADIGAVYLEEARGFLASAASFDQAIQLCDGSETDHWEIANFEEQLIESVRTLSKLTALWISEVLDPREPAETPKEQKRSMKKNWIDFKQLKESVKFAEVLAHYGIPMRPDKGYELVGKCPFHDEEKPSFRVNTEKNVFHCFGCGAKGNALDFVVQKEGVSVRKAALLLVEWFGADQGEIAPQKPILGSKTGIREAIPREKRPIEAEGNPALTFTLRLNSDHPYLAGRGLRPETVQLFGVGYCDRGLLKGRIAIPIHDEKGSLVAYAGRWPGDETPDDGGEKYKLPPGFKKSAVLFNLHRVKGSEHLVVVEGFFSVLRLQELGIPAVALMGTALSEHQEKLLQESGVKSITLMLDGNKAGREAVEKVLPRFAKHFSVMVAELPDGEQPDTVDEKDLLRLVGRGESHA